MRFLALALLPLLCGGCLASNLAEALKAAGQDPATVSINVKTIYGTIQWCRTGILNGNVVCDSNGITVKSDAQAIGVPINVVPQISVGQPQPVQPAPVQVAPPAPRSELHRWLAQPPDARDTLSWLHP